MSSFDSLRSIIESASLAEPVAPETAQAVEQVIALLTTGELRTARPVPASAGGSAQPAWEVLEWVKKAILLYFRMRPMRTMVSGPFEFHDKMDVQTGWQAKGVRVVPQALVREGAYVAPGCILMPSYVNIGAYVGEGTMIDTWATVGSCAQVGRRCHISGGVGIGGVLEPLQASPVIIEDDVFLGARCEVAEGVRVGEGAVLAMGCYVGASTKVYDAMTGRSFAASEGIPPRAVVVPGATLSRDGSHSTYTLIIKKLRDARTDARTALNEVLR